MATQPGADASVVAQYKEVIASPDFSLDASAEIAAYSGKLCRYCRTTLG
jgi:hypothetical protein